MKRNGGGGPHYQNVLQTSPQDGIPKAGLEGAGRGKERQAERSKRLKATARDGGTEGIEKSEGQTQKKSRGKAKPKSWEGKEKPLFPDLSSPAL